MAPGPECCLYSYYSPGPARNSVSLRIPLLASSRVGHWLASPFFLPHILRSTASSPFLCPALPGGVVCTMAQARPCRRRRPGTSRPAAPPGQTAPLPLPSFRPAARTLAHTRCRAASLRQRCAVRRRRRPLPSGAGLPSPPSYCSSPSPAPCRTQTFVLTHTHTLAHPHSHSPPL